MNKFRIAFLLILGVVLAAQSNFTNNIQVIHEFYADGYWAVSHRMPSERVSECAVRAQFLCEEGTSGVSEKGPSLGKDLNATVFYWQRRSFETAWSLEKQYYEKEFNLFTNTLCWIQMDFEAISRDRYSAFLLDAYAPCILMTLIQLQEETLPQRDWLSTSRLEQLFATYSQFMQRRSYTQSRITKKYATVMILMIIGNRISDYEKINGKLPGTLTETGIPDELKVDAWKREITYIQKAGRWFLLSLGERGVAEDVDIDNNSPFFQYNSRQNIVLYSGLFKKIREYYKTGKLKIGRYCFEKDQTKGTLITTIISCSSQDRAKSE